MPDSSKPEHILSYFDNLCESGRPLIWLSTISADFRPHVVPVCFVKPIGTKKIGIGAVFIKQTVQNIRRNQQVAIACSKFEQGYDGFMIQGKAEVLEQGEEFEKMKGLVLTQTGGKRVIKWLIVVPIESVYSLKPGEGTKRIEYKT